MKDFIVPVNYNTFIVLSDKKEMCYVSALKYIEKLGFEICGLGRTSKEYGAHPNQKNQYIGIRTAGKFADYFRKKFVMDKKKVDKKMVDLLSDEISKEWAMSAQGENREDDRHIVYAISSTNNTFVFILERVDIQVPDKSDSSATILWNSTNQVFAVRVEQDCVL